MPLEQLLAILVIIGSNTLRGRRAAQLVLGSVAGLTYFAIQSALKTDSASWSMIAATASYIALGAVVALLTNLLWPRHKWAAVLAVVLAAFLVGAAPKGRFGLALATVVILRNQRKSAACPAAPVGPSEIGHTFSCKANLVRAIWARYRAQDPIQGA